ncbi:bifunctional phosphoribosylaminoimidazolecarboxamide formyltransferase/IMP cyclohydrolase [Pelagibius litoralis]|uniref:Bifunctional purine biosynthesis protein PurH n=1 Tax=Pelagibius litoralis TaxID=374515 RepID=A0A967KH88_9PROT|nr:bifunctional phosphoribosylaminoimidazolecarboxamide formyltransferase/IMP cyclohydrolase [Pelagibius litoralis]NIA71026.1 bifunctional phosphoribosylaminoimidazolecarboxamide formyltransferase/IMP cyclohydrolase [Pelagibius litoralis]
MPLDTPTPVKRALVSVSDKTGLVEFGRFLSQQGVEILSTGGSARALSEAGIAVVEVASHTGFPEIMDGRVKTLHPKIHGGILARRDLPEHLAAMEEHQIAGIDMVVSNLYPFEATLASNADFDTCIENIDIGGPAMVRASAKNHDFVTIVTDPADYAAVQAEMAAQGGAVGAALRRRLAMTAFAHTAAYDAMIARWLAGEVGETFPKRMTASGSLQQTLRYGENPHQEAAVYLQGPARPGVATAAQLQGKELSYNNLNDTNAAFELVSEFDAPTVAIIKHANPCGVASRGDLLAAYAEALACDPVSAFGGIIAINRALDAETAEEISKLFAEVVIAPAVDDAARAALATKKNLRVLVTGAMADPAAAGLVMTPLAGGFLAQSRDNGRITREALKVVTRRSPSDQELDDMIFAFRVAKHVKSNAIVYARDGATVGVGAGQMSRIDSSRIAAWKAREAAGEGVAPKTEGSVVASDAFFPFADGLLAAAEAGATAVIQPGGSMRDAEVIKAADDAGLAMVFTGLRHFRH